MKTSQLSPEIVDMLTTGKERSDYLCSFPVNGYGCVESVYRHSFNLLFGKRLLHVSGYHAGLSVFGLTLPTDELLPLMRAVHVGDSARMVDGVMTITARHRIFSLDLAHFSQIPLGLQSIELPWDKLRDFDQTLGTLALESGMGLMPLCVVRAKVLLRPAEPDWAACAIHYLLGRGQGLTPGGDDLLVGYLAVLQCVPAMALVTQQFKAALAASDMNTTTRVSQNYLRACMDGYVSKDLHRLLVAVMRGQSSDELLTSSQVVLTMGHTSGHDTLGGMQIAIRIILEGMMK